MRAALLQRLMMTWCAPVKAANLSPSGSGSLGRWHLSRPEWRVAQQPGNPVYNDVFHHKVVINKEWMATNQLLCCKLGRDKSDGENSYHVWKLVLVCVLSPKSSDPWPLQVTPLLWPQFPQLEGVSVVEKVTRNNECARNHGDLTTTCLYDSLSYIIPYCIIYFTISDSSTATCT